MNDFMRFGIRLILKVGAILFLGYVIGYVLGFIVRSYIIPHL